MEITVKRKPPADEIDAERRVHAKNFAKTLRKQHTAAEEYLWYHIRRRQIAGFKFRDQQPVEGRIIDFYCAEARLGIEVDGAAHEGQKEADEQRQKFLEEQQIRIIRFSNDDVLRQLDRVLKQIRVELQARESYRF